VEVVAVEDGIAGDTCTVLGPAFVDYTDPSVEVYTAIPRASGPCIVTGDYVRGAQGDRGIRIDPARASVVLAACEVACRTCVEPGACSAGIEEEVDLVGIVASRPVGRVLWRRDFGIGLPRGRGWVVGMRRRG